MFSISFLVLVVSILAYFEFLLSFWLIFLDGSESILLTTECVKVFKILTKKVTLNAPESSVESGFKALRQ